MSANSHKNVKHTPSDGKDSASRDGKDPTLSSCIGLHINLQHTHHDQHSKYYKETNMFK